MAKNYGNIASCLWETSRAKCTALTISGGRKTPAEESRGRIAALAAAFSCEDYRLEDGDRAFFLSRNTDHLAEAMLAVMYHGAIAVPINTRWTSQEIGAAAQKCRPRIVFFEPSLRHLLSGSLDTAKLIMLGGEDNFGIERDQDKVVYTENLIGLYKGQAHRGPAAGGDNIAMIVFTSGTTGAAKGVCLTHGALSFQARTKIASHGYKGSDIYLHTAPLTHVGGLVSWLAMVQAGASQVFMPQFSPQEVVRLAALHKVTAMIAVPTMIADLVYQDSGVLSTVERLLLGGGELQASLVAPLQAMMPNARIWTAYGMTECASSITTMRLCTNPKMGKREGVCVGRPPPGISIGIAMPAQGEEKREGCSGKVSLSQGQIGEVITEGPHLMTGYWNDVAASDAAFLPGGWFRTGDWGWVDGRGQLWLAGRLKDVIRSGSENVNAGEVERVLLQHTAVCAAAVVGMPHERLGEQVAALVQVQIREPAISSSFGKLPPTSDILKKFCREKGLAGFKIPRVIYVQQDSLPSNASGKILKQQVKTLITEALPQLRSRL